MITDVEIKDYFGDFLLDFQRFSNLPVYFSVLMKKEVSPSVVKQELEKTATDLRIYNWPHEPVLSREKMLLGETSQKTYEYLFSAELCYVKFKAPVFAGSKQFVEYETWIERGDETKIPSHLEKMVSEVHVNGRLL